MPSKVLWSDLGTFTKVINGDATTPTLKGLAAGGRKLGNEIDNRKITAGDQYAEWFIKVRGATVFVAGEILEVYFIEAVDDTTYEDGDDSTTPSKPPAFIIPLRLVSTAQKITIPYVLMPPCKFKPLLVNTTARAFTATDGENELYYRPYDDEGQ